MSKQINHPSADNWHWKQETPFAQTVAVDDQIFISRQLSLDSNGVVLNLGDVAGQTRIVFGNMKQSLAELNLTLSDLVRLNT
jgi:enamine deaminase RidA (YjgF/YER057c/UK114 family)